MIIYIKPYDEKNIAVAFPARFNIEVLNAIRRLPDRTKKVVGIWTKHYYKKP